MNNKRKMKKKKNYYIKIEILDISQFPEKLECTKLCFTVDESINLEKMLSHNGMENSTDTKKQIH
jgi:hypothetical protein